MAVEDELTHEVADVLVVGAGASGAALSWVVSGDTDHRVVCLERGYWEQPLEYPTKEWDWEVRRQRTRNPNPNVRAGSADYSIDQRDTPMHPLLFNGVGGSTVMWSAHFPRMHPSDFRAQSLDGVGDDWPITYDDLAPYYELNDRMMGVAGIHGDPANPPREARPTPPVPLGRGGELVAQGFEKLGWHWWPSDVATITRAYGDDRSPCNNCGGMELGCSQKAKASTDITYWPRALSNGVDLRTGARVIEITTDDAGRATGARYLDAEGAEHFQPARIVVMACNGIGTPRLLLASTSDTHPDGLANSSGLVGRNLMHHPFHLAIGVFDEMLEGWKGPTACTIVSQEFFETDGARDFARGVTLQVLRSHGPVMTALGGWGVPIPWGEPHHARFDEVFGRTAAIAVVSEDLPEEHNRVSLDPDRMDEDGLPMTELHYTIGENTRRALEFGTSRAVEVLQAAGAKEVVTAPVPPGSGFHLMGTARMGTDPARSVVNGHGRTHDVDNLYIVDGSVFTTASSVNPTSTIQAIALRTGQHLLEELTA